MTPFGLVATSRAARRGFFASRLALARLARYFAAVFRPWILLGVFALPATAPSAPRQRRRVGRGGLAGLLTVLAALSCRPTSAAPQLPIVLPPVIVSDSTHARPWQYAAAPGLEVLARCDDDRIFDLVARTERLRALLATILPPSLQFQTTAPSLLLLVDAAEAPSMSQVLVSRFHVPGTPQVRMLPNLELHDVDLVASFAVVNENGPRRFFGDDGGGRLEELTFTPAHVRLLLERRTPPLPAWFVEGFMTLFDDMTFGERHIRLKPLTWVGEPETGALRRHEDAPRRLLPAQELFSPAVAPTGSTGARWRAEAALFTRWALDPADPARRSELWRFVTAAADGRADEAEFRTCFHFGYTGLRDRLSDSLPAAVRDAVTLPGGRLPPDPRLRIRDATPAEIGRIKGEWERLEVAFVQSQHPEYAPRYRELADQTLARARRLAPDDPGVLTASGLLESDRHRLEAARPYLEAAAMAGVVRPRVYAELARFRLLDALRHPAGPQQEIGIGQAEAILEPLQRALAEQPPLAATYVLMAQAWARCGARLTPGQLAILDDGVRRFPRVPELLLYAVLVAANQGRVDEALALDTRGLAASTTPAQRAEFERVRTLLTRAKRNAPGAAAPRSPGPAR